MRPPQDHGRGGDGGDGGQGSDGPLGPGGLTALLRRLVADACGRAPEEIEADRPLADYGLSSRDAVGISGELEDALNRPLPATLLWENPSLAELVRHLTEETGGTEETGDTGKAPEEAAAAEATPQPAATDDPAASRGASGPVAVVGIGCRLPGGIGGPDAFWEFLLRDGDAVSEVPAERWRAWGADTVAAATALPPATRWGAFLDDVAGFDAQFFGITPREAELMDPQQRLLLEVVWEALNHAGMPPPTVQGSSTGVYVGLSALEYGFLTAADLSRVTEWTSTGSAGSIVANRVSYVLDLRGPSLTVDTACSSSLVALHQACRGLRLGECDTALVAGVNVLLSPMITAGFDQAGVLAPDGRCRPFDAAARGIVRGEGCGVVVLKRLADAVRDGDTVLAVLRGTAVNSDGRSSGLVAPNPVAQQALLRAALRDAGADAAEVDYVETHGTGTLLGDPIEAGALSAVLGRDRPENRPLLIGSVKSNLGHLEGAAGITGLIKTVLALHHGTLPATVHFRRPNPHIDFTAGNLRVVSEATPWPAHPGRPARAGVSAFGFGGTNAHAVLEQWQGQPSEDTGAPAAPSVPRVLVVSARSKDRLADTALGLADWLTGPAGARASLDDVTHTLGNTRYGSVCAAVVGRDRDALARGLRALGADRAAKGVVGPRQPVIESAGPGPVFVFTGYGSQWAGMGRRLLADDDAFAAAVHDLDPVFAAETGTPLSRLITEGVPLTAVAKVQPLLYGLQLALARTWAAYGVEPAAVVGHSMGEVAAGVVAGALDPATGLRVMLRRSELLSAVDADRAGAMAAVALPGDERADTLARFPGVEVAVDASPRRCTVAGPAGAVGDLVAELEDRGIQARLLDVGGAGHTAAVDAVLPDLRAAFADIRARQPTIPWYGTAHDDPRLAPRADAGYWCDNARRPVRFHQAVAAAAADGHRAFLEISPHPVAAAALRETLDATTDGACLVLPTLLRDSDEASALHTSLAALHTAGIQRRPDLLWPTGRRTSLPTAPWRHTRHWVAARTGGPVRAGGHPLLGTRLDVPGTRRTLWRGELGTDGWSRLDQRVHGTSVLPLAVCAETVVAAAAEAFATAADGVVVHGLSLDRLLPLADGTPVMTLLDPTGPGRATVTLHTRSAAGTWTRHASATVEIGVPPENRVRAEPDGETLTVELPTVPEGPATAWQFDPAVLDACLRVPASATRGGPAGPVPEDAVPVAIGRLRVGRPTAAPGVCRVRPTVPTGDRTGPAPAGDRSGRTPPGDPDGAPARWSVCLEDAGGAVVLEAEGVALRVPEAREVPLPVSETAYGIAWGRTPLPDQRPAAPCDWLVLTAGPAGAEGNGDGTATALCAALRRAGGRTTVDRGDARSSGRTVTAWHDGLADDAPAAVVLLCTGPVGPNGARETILTAADVARSLVGTAGHAPSTRLFLVTEGAESVTGAEPGDPDRACLRGLLRVLALEHPDLRPCLVDIDTAPGAEDDLARELLGNGDADQVAWRAGTRLTARLSRVDPVAEAAGVPFVRPRGAYIVTGGLGGLGLATARRLAEGGAGRLVLNGRRPPRGEAEAVLREVRALGVEVEIVLGDIAEPGTAPRLVASAVCHGHALRGVAHAAGVLRDAVLTGLEPGDVDAVFRPKADGGRHLDEATTGHDLDWWLVFSSAAALLGSPGQAAYAAANAYLDALVRRRRARGAAGQSIAWGPWAGTGGAPDMAALAVDPLTPDEGLDALRTIVGAGRPYTGVVRLDARRVVRAFPGIESVPFFADLLGSAAEDTGERFGVEELRRLDRTSALAAVVRRLAARVATVMGFAEQEIDTTVPLTELGLDSLVAVRLRNAVKQDFGIVLPETLLLRGGSLDEAAAALLSALDAEGSLAGGTAETAAPDGTPAPGGSPGPGPGGTSVSGVGGVPVSGGTAVPGVGGSPGPGPGGTPVQGSPGPRADGTPVSGGSSGPGPDGTSVSGPEGTSAPPQTAPPLPGTVLPRDAAERLVAGVWARVSGRPAGSVHQELPEWRDDSASAVALAEGIRARLGGDISAPTAAQIRRSPTVAAVADLVRPALEGAGDTPLRVLRDPGPRTDRAPLFVFHPAGGSTSVFRPLTDLLPPGQPVFGLDRVESLTSVEDKAEHYLGLMRQVRSEGPYRLLGWSFGGCLAYEVAARLRERGERVGYLGLIDTILPAALPGPPPEEILLERFARFAEYVETAYGRRLRLPYRELAAMDEDAQVETLMRHVADAGLDMSPGVLEHQRTSYIDARIGERYRPRPCPEPVVLYRAQKAQALTTAIDPRYLRDDADLGWAPLCPRLEVVPVPGDHLSLIDPPYVEVIAGHLATAL
ncbi:SDR family NAD(P)-dependent oxidoreductase [Streptomyces sp.]|uniref:SDR family NAD(P)-dependent oxidoreductase n=1 Tax=Streptomyces sp. TaxID=1931 RepID=UPI002F42CEFA